MHQILYFIIPPTGWNAYKSKTVELQLDANGQPMMERWPEQGQDARSLRNLPALPDQVSPLLQTYLLNPTKKLTLESQIGTWENPLYILAWRKLEPSCTWEDILMRMANVRTRPINGNVLSMRISRMMDDYMIIFTWRGTKDWTKPSADQRRRLAKLDAQALADNSTRRYTPGLCFPEQGEAGGRVPVPVDHRKRSRGSYKRKTFVRKAPRASRATKATSSAAAKKRKAAVKGPKTKKPRLVVKLPVRVGSETTKRLKFEDDSDEDTLTEDGMIEDDVYEDDVGDEDVDEDPSSYYEDEDPDATADDEETLYSTPEKRVKIESSPLSRLTSAQDTPSYPFARPVNAFGSEQYGNQLNYQYQHPYQLSYATPEPKQEVEHIDYRNGYMSSPSYMPYFSAPQPVEPFTFGGNTTAYGNSYQVATAHQNPFQVTTALEDPFQVTYPTLRRERDNVMSRGSYLTGLNFAPSFAPTIPSDGFNFSAIDPSLQMDSFSRGNNNLTVNELLNEDAPHDQATEQDYAHDTYWFPKH